MSDLDACETDIICSTAEGRSNTEVARRWNVSSARITQRKHRMGQKLFEKSGGDLWVNAQARPQWQANIKVFREKAVCMSINSFREAA